MSPGETDQKRGRDSKVGIGLMMLEKLLEKSC